MLEKDDINLINSMIQVVIDEVSNIHKKYDASGKSQMSATKSCLYAVKAALMKNDKSISELSTHISKFNKI